MTLVPPKTKEEIEAFKKLYENYKKQEEIYGYSLCDY